MSFLLALSLALQVTSSLPTNASGTVDWEALAPLPWREAPVLTADVAKFVDDEVQAHRCTPPKRTDGKLAITADIAVLIRADGMVRVTVPRAIDCPTVEQFAAGLITSFARNNLRQAPQGWYRASVSFPLSK